MNPQAEILNQILADENPVILDLLSGRGKEIFFPKKGLMAQGQDAKGKRINASIGEAYEEDGVPMNLDCISGFFNMPEKESFPYCTSYGKPELRDTWQKMIRTKNPSLGEAKISRPVVTNALTHGLSLCGYLFLEDGEKMIVPDQYWGNYNLVFKNAWHTEFDLFTTFKDGRFNIEGLKEKLMEEGEKKTVLLNFPNNPTGYTPTKDEMAAMQKVFADAAKAGKKIVVFLDDAYFGLFYNEKVAKESFFAQIADLHENILAVKIDGATKEDYVWGFRVGFLTFACKGITSESCRVLEEKTAGAVRGNVSNISHPAQSILVKAYQSDEYAAQKQEKFDLLRSRYELLVDTINSHPEYKEFFEPLPFNSGYFMCIEMKNVDAEKVRQILLEKYDTGIIALGNLIRVAYSSLKSCLIPELFDNIYKASQKAAG